MASSSRCAFKRNASAVSTRQLPPPAKVGRVYTPVAEDDDPMFDVPRLELEEFIPAPLPSSSQSSTLPLQTIAPTSPLSRKSRRKGRQKASSQQASTQAVEEEEREDKTQAGPSVKSKTASNLNFQRLIISCTHFMQRPAHQERQNQAKREQRSGAEYKAHKNHKRAAAAKALDTDIAKAWLDEATLWISLNTEILRILRNATTCHKETLRAVCDVVARHEHIEPIVPEVWTLLPDRTAEFLVGAASGMQERDIAQAICDGILEESENDDERPFPGQLFYVRIAHCVSHNASSNPWETYLDSYPADIPWTVSQLLLSNPDLNIIETALLRSLERFNHTGAVHILCDTLQDSSEYTQLVGLTHGSRPLLPVYAGESFAERPGVRHADNVAAKPLSHFGNFLGALERTHQWRAYQLCELDMPHSSGARSDRIASDMEVLLVSVLRLSCLNSAPGGFIRRYRPDPSIETFLEPRDSLRSLYGSKEMGLAETATSALRGQLEWLRRAGLPSINPTALESAMRNFTGVLRETDEGVIPFLRIMKDISWEDFEGEHQAPWQSETGKALQSFRHIQHMICPDIPLSGDLTIAEITGFLGPSVDFWRFIVKHPWYWLHLVWMAQLLGIVRPIVISTWSDAMFTMCTSGALSTMQLSLPLHIRVLLSSGTTPDDILKFLPESPDNWYPTSDDDQYIRCIGNLFIISCCADAASLALLIPNLDCGAIKYDPKQAYLSEQIIHLVSIIEKVALGIVNDFCTQGIVPDRSNAEATWKYFESLRDAVEVRLQSTPIRAMLNRVKEQYARCSTTSGHLRRLRVENVNFSTERAAPYDIPGFTHAAPKGPERLAQYEAIMDLARRLIRGGLLPDPYHLVPFQYRQEMFGEQYKTWLLSRDEGIRISCASRVYGNSQEAYDNAIAGQQRLAEDHDARSLGGFATTAVLQARRKEREAFEEKIKVIIDGVLDPYRQRKNQKLNGNHSTVDEFRWGRCGDCNTLVLGKDTNCYHECAKNSPRRKLSEDLFPTLIRIMYTHDVFNDPVLSSLIPTFSHFGLQRVAVQDVLERPGNMGVLLKTFPGAEIERIDAWPSIYVRADDVDEDMEFTLAVDSILPMLSTCPSDFVPTNSKQRGAPWGSCRAPPDEWIGKHLLRCDFGTLALVNPPLQHHYDHACSQTPQREDAERQEKQRLGLKYSQNKSAGGPRDCGTQRVIRVKSLLQLPSEYLRRYWFHKRIFPIIAKKAKKGKGKAQ